MSATGEVRSLLALALTIQFVLGADVASARHTAGSVCAPNWTVYPSPNVGQRNNFLYSISAASPADGWSVGYWDGADGYPRALIEHWNGDSWKVLRKMPDSGPGASLLLGVSVVSEDDVWAVGYRGGLPNTRTLIEHRGTSGWTVVDSPNVGSGSNVLYAVSAVGTDDVWAVGSYWDGRSSRTLTEHWNGTAWNVVESPNVDPGSNKLAAVSARAPDDAWTVGATALEDGTRQTLTEHWDGDGWSVVESEDAEDGASALLAVAQIGHGVLAVGSSQDPDGDVRVLAEVWTGDGWRVIPADDPGARRDVLTGSTQLDHRDALAVGGYGDQGLPDRTLVERLSASGLANEPGADLGTSDAGFLGVTSLSEGDAWAVGYREGPPSARTLIERRCG
jgi:hypothetical protein